jgi:quercetin dioxygenase-like cupin family protein
VVAGGYTIKRLDEFEKNGRWSLVRRGLDVGSFGLNVVEIEQGYSIPEHNEVERDQEEVFIVLEGDAVLVIDGEEHPAPAGTFARVAPPLSRTVRNDKEAPVRLLICSAPTTSGYADMGWA